MGTASLLPKSMKVTLYVWPAAASPSMESTLARNHCGPVPSSNSAARMDPLRGSHGAPAVPASSVRAFRRASTSAREAASFSVCTAKCAPSSTSHTTTASRLSLDPEAPPPPPPAASVFSSSTLGGGVQPSHTLRRASRAVFSAARSSSPFSMRSVTRRKSLARPSLTSCMPKSVLERPEPTRSTPKAVPPLSMSTTSISTSCCSSVSRARSSASCENGSAGRPGRASSPLLPLPPRRAVMGTRRPESAKAMEQFSPGMYSL
mmetsp:Transcript_18370/g.43061  ORF Transcript_18370/g.43061 Transcript_18370/m.43061 type:complete len:262 (-) Transcript_18370:1628-2413(-)